MPLFDGKTLGKWQATRGTAHAGRGLIVIDGRAGPATVQLMGHGFKDGMIEIDVWAQKRVKFPGPYTVGLRGKSHIDAILIECGPERIVAGKDTASYTPTKWPEYWRFDMEGGTIDVHRFGEKILTYQDIDPKAGMVSLSADSCLLQIRGIRYRGLE
jgi:hypothetical protein